MGFFVVVYRLIDSFDCIGSQLQQSESVLQQEGSALCPEDLLPWCTDSLAVGHELSDLVAPQHVGM